MTFFVVSVVVCEGLKRDNDMIMFVFLIDASSCLQPVIRQSGVTRLVTLAIHQIARYM